MEIYNKIINTKPFCFVRINDGEASAIISESAFASRGDEQSSPELSDRLSNILSDSWSSNDLFIGVPCINCYHDCFKFVRSELIKAKTPTFVQNNTMDANILINSNYDKTLDILMNYLVDRHVIIVSNETIIGNINRLTEKLGIPVSQTYTVSAKMAFQNDYTKLKDLVFQDGSFIITLCGPLGRVLAYEWFRQNETLSCLDLGSFFDPLLRNKSYLYHTNNHRYCSNCYPTADPRFTNIFNYCTEPVEKECYYLGTYQDHVNLYNRDFNRIILNMRVRLEKDPYNLDLHRIMSCSKVQLFAQSSNQRFDTDISNYKTIIGLCKQKNPMKVLEIGFGASTLLFLEHTHAYVTSIDLNSFNTEYLQKEYNNRLTFIKGNSLDVVPTLTDIYGIIYIDGSNEYSNVLADLVNCYYKSNAETIVIVNGIVRKQKFQEKLDTMKAFDKCVSEKMLLSFHEEDFEYKRGIAAANYNWSNNGLVRFNNLTSQYMGKYNYIVSLIDTIDVNTEDGEKELKKLLTYIEEVKLLKIKKDSQEGYAFQVPEQFEDLMNFCHSKPISNVLEIGFLHGSSALMFLMNTDANVTSIDIFANTKSEEYISNMFPDRFKIVHGNSKDVLNSLLAGNETYDVIYIDGGHDYKTVKDDLLACQYLMNDDTVIIMNDVVSDSDLRMFWNNGPTQVYIETDKVDILDKVYSRGRGLAMFQLKKKDFTNEMAMTMNKTDLYKEITSIVNVDRLNLLQKLNVLTDTYLNYFSMIMNNDEYYLMKYYHAMSCGDLNKMEELISERHIPTSIRKDAIEFVNVKYNNDEVTIPKIVHLIYINQRPLKSFNYKCINSVLRNMPDYQVWIHNDIEPVTEEWTQLKQNCNVVIKKIERVKEFDGFVVSHVQYEADIIRMNLLYEYGGIYLDTDIYMVKNVNDLLDGHGFYIARETEDNLINCAIISEPKNEFIKIWLKHFATGFRIGVWGWHIRDLPKIILDKYPHYLNKYNIRILDYENFCPVHWTQGHMLNDPNFKVTEKMYGVHLFETILGNSLDGSVIVNY